MIAKRLVIALIFSLSLYHIYAQKNMSELADSVSIRFLYQLQAFPQEKIFVHIDKNYYVSGEKIWFRTHLVNASDHLAKSLSRYVYVELINPLDSLISRVKIRPDENRLFHGYIQLPEQLPEGNYIARAYTGFMQNSGEAYFFRKKIRIGNPASSRVRSRIIYDKESGEESVKIYFTDKQHNKMKPKRVNVRYGNGRMRSLKPDSDGIGTLSMKLLMEESNPIVYAEFEDEGVFYSEFIEVSPQKEDFDVSFFPEGGNLLGGTLTKTAFKAMGVDGLSENITGEVIDEVGNILSSLEIVHSGMGIFSFIPVAGKKYYAICRNEKNIEKRFELPNVLSGACGLKLGYSKEKLFVSVSRSADKALNETLYILIHSKGIVKSFFRWDEEKEAVSIEKNDLPPGIIQVLLLDQELNILSERLFFNTHNMQVETRLVTNKKEYNPRQHVSTGVDITDKNNKPLSGNFSVSVTNDNDLPPDTVMNIMSYLLLSSEIKGYIESPEQYIGDNKNTLFKQDLLMLTQGWRRYDLPSVLKGKYTIPEHPLEIGQEISGIVKSGFFKVKGTKDNQVSLLSPDIGYFDITETDDNGHFYFHNFEHPDSTTYFVQALSRKGRKTVELYLDLDSFPSIDESMYMSVTKVNVEADNERLFENYTIKADQKYTMENGMRMIHLKEVKVTAQKKERPESIYMPAEKSLFSGEEIERATTLESLLHRIPAARVMRDEFHRLKIMFNRNFFSSFSGASYATYIVDDIIMDGDFDPEVISIHDIEEIGVIKGAESAILGMRGSGGAVVIKTKTGNGAFSTINSFNIGTITPLGYQTPAEFYSPKYETKEQKNNTDPDLRTTIYWKPDVIVSEDGKASFEFYTADTDRQTSYSIIIQGVTDDGQIIYKTEKIKVK